VMAASERFIDTKGSEGDKAMRSIEHLDWL
jgi:hypothetical protein